MFYIILVFISTVLLTLFFTKPQKKTLKDAFKQMIRTEIKMPENGGWVAKALTTGLLEVMISDNKTMFVVHNCVFFNVGYVFSKKDAISATAWHIKPREEFIGIFGQWKHLRSVGIGKSFSKKT